MEKIKKMKKANIIQLNQFLKDGATVEPKQIQLVVSVDEHNSATTKTVFRAIVNKIMYEITANTFKQLCEKLKKQK